MAPVETRSHAAPGSALGAPARDTIHVPTTERPSTTPPAEPRGSTSGPPENPDDDDDNDPDNDPKGKGPERHVSLPPPEGIAYIGLPQAKAYKSVNPKPYSREKTEDLDAFVTQLGIYMLFYSQSITNDMQRIVAASQFLTGKAMTWFQPLLQDFLVKAYKREDALQQETRETFKDYEAFIAKVRDMFGNPLKKEEAEKQLYTLK
ncbi:hypothetical protein F5Y02DRAFT_103101 [Annulohypoxylon stygium]|nr:hypothetical protein F5Y02DRAFT_103101 [Annulohypoxylon stygium]